MYFSLKKKTFRVEIKVLSVVMFVWLSCMDQCELVYASLCDEFEFLFCLFCFVFFTLKIISVL